MNKDEVNMRNSKTTYPNFMNRVFRLAYNSTHRERFKTLHCSSKYISNIAAFYYRRQNNCHPTHSDGCSGRFLGIVTKWKCPKKDVTACERRWGCRSTLRSERSRASIQYTTASQLTSLFKFRGGNQGLTATRNRCECVFRPKWLARRNRQTD